MKHSILFIIVFIFIILVIGTAYANWLFILPANSVSYTQASVPDWVFSADTDFALISNFKNATNLTVSKEETITQHSIEAIRITSTTGTTSKDHIININFDRDYYLSEIQFFKFEFDYYHRYKREQYNRGFPSVQFMNDNTTLGTLQGGTDTCTNTSAFIATPIDEDWWHLEYFVFAHIPTMAKHNDSPIALTKKINGVRINDKTMFDYAETTAFAVIDNMKFSSEPASRLGIFNRWSGDSAGKYFWFKVAFAGELNSCILESSDTTLAIPEFSADDSESTTAPFPNGSPFYVQLLKAGIVTLTATLDVGSNHTIMTISNTITIT